IDRQLHSTELARDRVARRSEHRTLSPRAAARLPGARGALRAQDRAIRLHAAPVAEAARIERRARHALPAAEAARNAGIPRERVATRRTPPEALLSIEPLGSAALRVAAARVARDRAHAERDRRPAAAVEGRLIVGHGAHA